jgi:site-specific DNA recombinase
MSASVIRVDIAESAFSWCSITQELGDDPMGNMIRQIMALFDEYETAPQGR